MPNLGNFQMFTNNQKQCCKNVFNKVQPRFIVVPQVHDLWDVVPGGTLNNLRSFCFRKYLHSWSWLLTIQTLLKKRDRITHDIKLKNLRSVIAVVHTTSIFKKSCFHTIFNMRKKASNGTFIKFMFRMKLYDLTA